LQSAGKRASAFRATIFKQQEWCQILPTAIDFSTCRPPPGGPPRHPHPYRSSAGELLWQRDSLKWRSPFEDSPPLLGAADGARCRVADRLLPPAIAAISSSDWQSVGPLQKVRHWQATRPPPTPRSVPSGLAVKQQLRSKSWQAVHVACRIESVLTLFHMEEILRCGLPQNKWHPVHRRRNMAQEPRPSLAMMCLARAHRSACW